MKNLNPFKRAGNWKRYVEASLQELRQSISSLRAQHDIHSSKLTEVSNHMRDIELFLKRTIHDPSGEGDGSRSLADLLKATYRSQSIVNEFIATKFENEVLSNYFYFPKNHYILLSKRFNEVLFFITNADVKFNSYVESINIEDALTEEHVSIVIILDDGSQKHRVIKPEGLLEDMRARPTETKAWLEHRGRKAPHGARPKPMLDDVLQAKDLIDFIIDDDDRKIISPYLVSYVPAEPKSRSVLFTRHCYYNFYYLAKALRSRGWDAVSLSTESTEGANGWLYHGQDLVLHDPDPDRQRKLIGQFYSSNAGRFGIYHHYGLGVFSLFPDFHDVEDSYSKVPWDMIEAKRRGVLLGYSHSGCLDGVSQSRFRQWSPSMCRSCPWELRPDICSDAKNLAWGRKVTSLADLVCTETDPSIDYKASDKTFRGPLTFALDPQLWAPDITPPAAFNRGHSPDKVVVYHAVGNFKERSRDGRNVKGTQAVLEAVARLRREGIDIEIDFVDNVASWDNRFVQVQADIIVDQLNYGRYGALAREGMMLGKPVVGRVNKIEHDGSPATACIQETPIVHADEETVADVLRDLAANPGKRLEIGRASREHAIKWWSADRLAERFERVYDHIRDHGRPPAETDVP